MRSTWPLFRHSILSLVINVIVILADPLASLAQVSSLSATTPSPSLRPVPLAVGGPEISAPQVRIVDVRVTTESQRFLRSYLPILRPGMGKGELQPVIADGTPLEGNVFIILKCTLIFPGPTAAIDLEQDLFLANEAGDKKTGCHLTTDIITDNSGKTFTGFWKQGKFALDTPHCDFSLLFSVPERQTKMYTLQFLGNSYRLWPAVGAKKTSLNAEPGSHETNRR